MLQACNNKILKFAQIGNSSDLINIDSTTLNLVSFIRTDTKGKIKIKRDSLQAKVNELINLKNSI